MHGAFRIPQSLLGLVLLVWLSGCGRDAPDTTTAPKAPLAVETYVVADGDTITAIALKFSVDSATIVDANAITDHQVHAGQVLLIPGGHRTEVMIDASAPKLAPIDLRPTWYIPRSTWAKEAVIVKRTKPMAGTPTRITVHHSGGIGDGEMNPIQWLQVVDHQHMLGTGHAEPWACIGYHFIIAADGRVFEGRPLIYQGAHAGWDEVNRLNIGICLIGDFDHEVVPSAQRRSLLRVLDRLCEQYHISHAHVFGHSHFKVTDCPGRNLRAIVEVYSHPNGVLAPDESTDQPAQAVPESDIPKDGPKFEYHPSGQ